MKLPREYYQSNDVVGLAKDLLGKKLCTKTESGLITSGRIVETEAYDGTCDKASHAWPNKKTKRTKVMFKAGGLAYVYLCYGIHHLFNVITGEPNVPHAILIRAIEPLDGISDILNRRNHTRLQRNSGAGPGVVSMALGISTKDNGCPLTEHRIWLEDTPFDIADADIIASPRVGIAYAGEDALLPWRFRIRNHPFTSTTP